jgi:predicted lysophospholipase L1 biosynthesis ABC-type transport system permease subunit
MKNLGALKAVGYTSGQLVRTLLLQFTGLSMLAALAGAGLSYLLFPAVNDMMISQTGIPYAVRFLPLPLFAAVAISACAVSLSVWLSARKIKKIEPITALRSGVQAQTLKRNHVPLDKAKVPLNAALALKTALSGIKHNVTVCVTVLVLSLVVVFSGLMAENVIGDFTPFLNLIAGETADSCINVEASAEQEFLQQMRSDDRVEKIYLFHSLNVVHAGGAELMATMYDDFSELNNKSVVYEGRFPERADEIAVAGKYAGENDLKIGDEISITANGKTEKYVICGYTQISNYLGRDCLLTRKGYERLGSIISASYYINLANGVDIDEFNAEAKEKFAGKISTAVNIKTVMEGAAKVYVTLMKIIVIAILVLSALIIAFVLYLLVRTMLNNKKRDYGILKSLGFTSGQLVMQTALAFMPAVILSTVAGLILGSIVINPLMSLFLSGIGIVKCTFTVPAGFVTAAGAGIIALSFAIACLLSLKVKKIAPCALLRGE